MTIANQLRVRLRDCPAGPSGWREYEEVCIESLVHLFVPPLQLPRIQSKTISGIDRRDAVFAYRIDNENKNWAQIKNDFDVRMLLFEFKNYDAQEIGKDDVNQTLNYIREPMGRLAVLCTNERPNQQAYVRRNTIWSESKKLILFVTKSQLIEMISMKERNADPAGFLLDLIETFYLEYE